MSDEFNDGWTAGSAVSDIIGSMAVAALYALDMNLYVFAGVTGLIGLVRLGVLIWSRVSVRVDR